jgi:hypothetical protein
MNNFANSMKEIQTEETLLSHLSNDRQWRSFVVVSLDNFKEVNTKDFKNCDEMLSVGTVMKEAIQ